MSLGGILGAVAGGIIGYFVPGLSVLYGASIGFTIGMVVDPITPDIEGAGAPLPDKLDLMPSEIGVPLPDLGGTAKIVGHLLCFGKERTVELTVEVEGGCFSGDEEYTTGYEYYMSWAVGIVAGPVDMLYTIYRNDDVVWEGELDIPASGGQETITLDGMGSVIFYFGTGDQAANSDVGEIIGDETLNSPYRHLCWCFFDDCYIGEFNRCPTMKFVLRKTPEIAFSGSNVLQVFDYNPMHAIWYTLHDLAGLPEEWLHSADFAAAAATLASESRGISCFFHDQRSVLDYLEGFNDHIDGILRYGADGKFHPKLIREDYVVDDLLSIDESVMLDTPTMTRKSWIDTINEVKVQYSEIVRDLPQGQWVAAMPQPDTPYVYLYDITAKAVIKLSTVTPTMVVDVLFLEPLYSLDYDKGHGNPGAQRGGYCMNKNGNKLWYLFRDTSGDCELIEVDISTSMEITKKTSFPALMPEFVMPTYLTLEDGCSDNTYTYWCTKLTTGRIIKIRNSDHVIVDDHSFNFSFPGCASMKQGINSIDVDVSEGKLYWNYVLDHHLCVPSDTACVHRIISDLNFNIELDVEYCGSGFATPWWQNMIRLHEGFVFQHQAYWPSSGGLWKRELNTYDDCGSVNQEYLQNIFGVKDDIVFTLMHVNSLYVPTYLYCLHFADMGEISKQEVCYYTGHGDSVYDWSKTPVSALSQQTGVIIVVRYNTVKEKNYVASFRADSTLTLLSDEGMRIKGRI